MSHVWKVNEELFSTKTGAKEYSDWLNSEYFLTMASNIVQKVTVNKRISKPKYLYYAFSFYTKCNLFGPHYSVKDISLQNKPNVIYYDKHCYSWYFTVKATSKENATKRAKKIYNQWKKLTKKQN